MEVLRYVLTSIFGLCGLVLIAVIMLQEGKSAGLGSLAGMSETFWEKNKARSMEGKLEKISKIAGIVFLALAFVLCVNF